MNLRTDEPFGSLESLDIPANDGVAMWPANRLWVQEGFAIEPGFMEACRVSFDAKPAVVDFKSNPQDATTMINNWVADSTRGMIPKLIEANTDTAMVLTNAVYFCGPWSTPFEERDTVHDQRFTRTDDSSTIATFMVRHGYMPYTEDENVQVLDLSYKGGSVSFVIILPKETSDLQKIEVKMSVDLLDEWMASLKVVPVELYLPKFEIRSRCDAVAALRSLGMKSAFSVVDADFSGIAKDEGLYIDQIPMETVIAVNEEGTKAAATSMETIVAPAFAPEELSIFRTDRPFLFLIRHRKSGVILFLGRFVEPSMSP